MTCTANREPRVNVMGKATVEELLAADFGSVERYKTFVTLTVDIGRSRIIWFARE